MAWGKQKEQAPPSTIRQLLPLIITLVILGAVAWVGYQIYLSLGKIQAQARRRMGDNVTFTKDGMRVNVQGIEAESYLDRTQSWVVKAWELGSGSSPNENDEAARRKRNVLTKPKPGESHH
ncbi:hypothetical protein C8A01DRAFT_45740 [Parachaetomium inaequale]|uniref:Uncharacterized protein n=1 Tax=Parachaetomium inaequale TaxID=2588326 RepID=A0AAN6PHE4_9PEZI|nr:hypothetical protein C8A01DRAFT_45740 [Parachaetomium inaequale]